MSGAKDRYADPVIEMPEPENNSRHTFVKRDIFNSTRSAESSPTDAFTGDIHTVLNSKRTLAETINM